MTQPTFKYNARDPSMKKAAESAQQTFKYFWRELTWERRRIIPRELMPKGGRNIPGLDMAAIKLPFTDGSLNNGEPKVEQMWVSEVDFDGEFLSGELINSPSWLTSIKKGDIVRAPFSNLSDWMMTFNQIAYGGFTVHLIRWKMSEDERKQHDKAWGLNFGNPAEVRLEIPRENMSGRVFSYNPFDNNPKINRVDDFKDHPICINVLAKTEERLKENPEIANIPDEEGFTMLHWEALAGNFGNIRLLVKYGADVDAKTPSGRTASELARIIGWLEIAEYLESRQKS